MFLPLLFIFNLYKCIVKVTIPFTSLFSSTDTETDNLYSDLPEIEETKEGNPEEASIEARRRRTDHYAQSIAEYHRRQAIRSAVVLVSLGIFIVVFVLLLDKHKI